VSPGGRCGRRGAACARRDEEAAARARGGAHHGAGHAVQRPRGPAAHDVGLQVAGGARLHHARALGRHGAHAAGAAAGLRPVAHAGRVLAVRPTRAAPAAGLAREGRRKPHRGAIVGPLACCQAEGGPMRGRRLGWVPGTAAVVTLMVLTMYSGFLISRLVTAVNGCVLFSDIGEAAAGSKVRAPPSRPPRSASARAARPQQGGRPPCAGALAGAGDCAQLRRDAVHHPAPRDLAEPAARGRQRGRAARGVLAGHRDCRAVLHPGAQPLQAGLVPRMRPIFASAGRRAGQLGRCAAAPARAARRRGPPPARRSRP